MIVNKDNIFKTIEKLYQGRHENPDILILDSQDTYEQFKRNYDREAENMKQRTDIQSPEYLRSEIALNHMQKAIREFEDSNADNLINNNNQHKLTA